MDTTDTNKRPIQSLEKAFDILEALRELDGARVTELANHLDMPKSTTYRYLATLNHGRFVVNEGGTYRPSLQFLNYGAYARRQYNHSEFIKEKTSELADLTGERAQFFVEEHGKSVHLYTESGQHGISADVRVGKIVPLHATSGGKAILAYLPEEEVQSILDRHGMPGYTENTITERDDLFEELAEIRESKISYNREERVNGLYSVGCPVVFNDRPIGAFSVTGSKRRMQGERAEDEIPNILLELTDETELKIEYDR